MTNELVKINENNQVTTTSLKIAGKFNKRHCDIIRDIKNLEIPEDFRKRNFALSSYRAGTRNYLMYEVTYDGFTILAMGYTGKKAMKFKIDYINAFNAMLKELASKPVIVSEHTRALPSGKKEIVLSARAREEIGGIVRAVVLKALSDHALTAVSEDRIAGACKKAIDEAFKMDIRNDNMFSLYKFVKIACQKAVREEIKKIKLTF